MQEACEQSLETPAAAIDLDFDDYESFLAANTLPKETDMAEMKLLGALKWSIDFDFSNGQFEGFSIRVPDQDLQAEFSYYDANDEEQMINVDIPVRKVKAEIDMDSMTGDFNALSFAFAPRSILWSPESSVIDFRSN